MNLNRMVHLFGEINHDSITRVTKEIIQLHKDDADRPIDLLVASSGGQSDPGFAFYDFILASKISLRTFTSGNLSSMALIVFLAGGRRYVGPHICALLHQAQRNFGNNFLSTSEIVAASREITIREENYEKIIIERTRMKADELSLMLLRNTVVDSKQMIEMGIAHELWIPVKSSSA